MIKGFVCPDGERCDATECLSKCRLSARCAPRPILHAMQAPKENMPGIFSVTQLIAPTRISYLRATREYYVDPQDQMKMMLGSMVHASMSKAYGTTECLIVDSQVSGKFDLLDEGLLIDYKVWGAYRCATASGMQKITIKNPVTNRPNQKWVPDGIPELDDETLQLNRYRMLQERTESGSVRGMYIFGICKDAGLQAAFKYGIDWSFKRIDIPYLADDIVWQWFENKRLALKHAITDGKSPCCDSKENWNGNRCKSCEVAEFCEVGMATRSIELETENAVA